VKFAIRQLLKSPGFAIVSLVTLALGIGVNTTAFTILNRLLLQGLPYPEPGRLVKVYRTGPQGNDMGQSPGDFFDEREGNNVFERMAVYYVNGMGSLAEKGQPTQRATEMKVTADFLPIIGMAPVLGRGFTADDEAHHAPVVILSYAFWQKHYSGDPAALGRTIRLDGEVLTIVGVMTPDMDDPMLFGNSLDIWKLDPADVNRNVRDLTWYQVAGRLKPGVTISQAQAAMTAVAMKLAHDFPKTNTGRGFRVVPYPSDTMGETGRFITWMIMDLALVVLLIACVNLANLQLVRTTGRAKEFAVRLALGSPRSRLVWMLLLESLILSLAGGALGLLVAKWGNSYVAAFFNMKMPLDLRVLMFAFVASALTGAVFGVLPAWVASRSNVNETLKQGSRGATSDRSRHRLRHSLIVVELAMALTLLTGAGYFVRGIQRMASSNQGWRPENLLMGVFSLSHDHYGEQGDERSRVFGDQLRAKLLALPGVDHAAISRGFMVLGSGGADGFVVEGRPRPAKGAELVASAERVSPGYFAACGIHLEQGRDFTDADRAGAPHVAIISKSMGRKLWPGENPIGKRIGDPDPAKPDWSEIVGVVDDIDAMGDTRPPETHFEIYRPWAQNTHRFMAFTLHSKQDARTVKDGVRKLLASMEPDVAISFMDTAQDIMKSSMTGINFVRRTLVEIALLGLLLSAVGIYGVIANLASERTQEIGIRMALGAQSGNVLWLLLRNGIRLALIGTAIGLLCSYFLMKALNKAVAFVPGNDPSVVALVALLLIGVALLACWIPAKRATRVNPVVALRAD
jgi:putative ABC transport system permease protein